MQKLAVSDTILPRRHAAAFFNELHSHLRRQSATPSRFVCMANLADGDTAIFGSPQRDKRGLAADGTGAGRQPVCRSRLDSDCPPRFGVGWTPGEEQVEEG